LFISQTNFFLSFQAKFWQIFLKFSRVMPKNILK
jgi:hypothetical protein